MVSDRYDGIIIGGGHNALVCGSYLAKAGLRILILERKSYLGGGAVTVESRVPYFKFNLHAFSFIAVPMRPPFRDLELSRYCRLLLHPVQMTQILGAGPSLTVYTDLEKTAKSFDKISPQDGKKFRKLSKFHADILNKHWVSLTYTDAYSRTDEEENRFLDESEGGRYLRTLENRTAIDSAREEWESEEIRALWAVGPVLSGVMADQPDSAHFLASGIPLLSLTHAVEGGSGNFVRALIRVFLEAGGTTRENSQVESVVVQDGEAKGVTLADGSKIWAEKFVASGVDMSQSYLKFIGRDHLDKRLRKQVEEFSVEEGTDLSIHLAMRESPQYDERYRRFNPDLQQSLRAFIGFESLKDVSDDIREIRSGVYSKEAEKQRFQALVPTRVDPTQAPPGRHTALIWDFVKCRGSRLAEWDTMGEEFAKRDLEKWQVYAPNMNNENVLDVRTYTPRDFTREYPNMVHGSLFMRDPLIQARDSPGYRTPIKNYYLCASACYPGGGITMAPGYIAAGIIAEDLGIRKWWNPIKFGEAYPVVV